MTSTTPPSTPPPPPPSSQLPPSGPDGGPRVTADEVRDLSRLRRLRHGRTVGGVAGGVARHLDVDPVLVKILFVVFSFFGGAGLILYGVLWLLVPEEDTGRAVVHLDERSRTVALVVTGVVAGLALVGDAFAGGPGFGGGLGFPWPITVIGLIVVAVLLSRSSSARADLPPGAVVAPTGSSPYRPPNPPGPARWVPPPDPRKRGPVLFWPSAALAVLGIGVLLTLRLAGVPVPGSAYPALVLGVCGVTLLVGAFWGRAGGLIAVGLVAALATAGATIGDRIDGGRIAATPTSAADVKPSYELDAGEIVLDLTDVDDLDALDGRRIELDVDLGRVSVLVPQDLSVQVDGEIRGDGEADVLGGGDAVGRYDAGAGSPVLTLEPTVGFGEIDVRLAGDRPTRVTDPRSDR